MNLPGVDHNRAVTVSMLGRATSSARLDSVGIREGVTIEVLGRTASRGFLVKVDDTRVVVGFDLAKLICCAYPSTE